MLINQHNSDILPRLREVVECAFDCAILGFGIDDEVVFLGVGRVGDVLCRSQEHLD